jgi:rhamnose transport system ATP-binding protein
MVGRELDAIARRVRGKRGAAVFSSERLTRRPLFENISLQIHAGEILGLAGLIGAGRSEFARAVYGLYPAEGTMQLQGKLYAPKNAAAARRRRVVYLPEERKRQGFVLEHSLQSSIGAGLLDRLSRFGWIFASCETQRTADAATKLQIKFRSLEQPVGTLSGGNQQKALLARWLENDPQFIILDEPTRGVDVGAKAEIHRLISNLAAQGKAILLISSDLPELLALSDRILVLHRGKTTAEFDADDATQEKILLAAAGFHSHSQTEHA